MEPTLFSYERLSAFPRIFPSVTGLTRDEFDRLATDFIAARMRVQAAATHTKRSAQTRQRAAGAGHPHAHDDRTRLLMALVWLRLYPTYALLGFFFDLDPSNAWHNVQDVLAVLATLADFPFERPAADRPKLRHLDQVFAAFPEVKAIVDAKEQPFHRLRGWANQKPFYSGKKKDHTVKTQIVCTPAGRIGAVSPSVPGSVHDLEVLRRTDVLENLAPEEGWMGDKAYCGAEKERPEGTVVVPTKKPKGGELTDAEKVRNRWLASCRIVVEHVNAQLSRFEVLKQVFRSVLGRHSQAMRVVALLVDRRGAALPLRTRGLSN